MEGEQSRLPWLSLLSGKICEIYAARRRERPTGVRPTSSRVGGSLSLLPSLKKLCILCSLAPHPARSRSFGRSVLI